MTDRWEDDGGAPFVLVTQEACPQCGIIMEDEHQHLKCPECKFVVPCCEGGDCG
jgi:hypothetical protein